MAGSPAGARKAPFTSSARARVTVAGALAGLAASPLLAPAQGVPAALGLGLLAGAAHALAFRPGRSAVIDGLMSGAALGVPLWLAVDVLIRPVAAGTRPAWTAAEMRASLPALVGFVLFGAAAGLVAELLARVAARTPGPAVAAGDAPGPPPPRRVVVLGGGFAGVTAARELERLLGADRSVALTLVSETNALLFTPMLAEVAGSSLEPTHITTPLRTSLRRTSVLRGRVVRLDLAGRAVVLARDGAEEEAVPFDHLVLALGAVTHYFGNERIRRHAIGFKSLREAMRVRNRVIDAFERAERERDADRRRALLTFVVAGGGFAGVELAGALNDFARGMLAGHHALSPADLRVVLVHSQPHILPELSESLGTYALQRLRARGVSFELSARVADVGPGEVRLGDGRRIPARTVVWAAGAAPGPLPRQAGLPVNDRGAVVVEPTLAVAGHPGLWALGDCAAVPDARTGRPCPPTAQFALREARTAAANVVAALRVGRPRAFRFDALGSLCVVGHHTACAELRVPFTRTRFVRFSGLLAWLLWRGIYLSKLPGLDRKVRVIVDWTLELFFPRDIVQTLDLEPAPEETPP
jgi:NADH dehydrogenase